MVFPWDNRARLCQKARSIPTSSKCQQLSSVSTRRVSRLAGALTCTLPGGTPDRWGPRQETARYTRGEYFDVIDGLIDCNTCHRPAHQWLPIRSRSWSDEKSRNRKKTDGLTYTYRKYKDVFDINKRSETERACLGTWACLNANGPLSLRKGPSRPPCWKV